MNEQFNLKKALDIAVAQKQVPRSEVAKAANMEPSALSRATKTQPQLHTLIRISTALNMSLSEFIKLGEPNE